MVEMQRCTIFSHGKVKLGKQALATDRRLSGVKKGHFSKILQERRKRSNIGEANERRAGVISWGKGGWNTIQKQFITCLCTSPFQAMQALLHIGVQIERKPRIEL